MPEIHDNLTPAERGVANHTNLIEAYDYFLRVPGVEPHPTPDLTGVITGKPAGFLNPITVSNFPVDEADARIDAAMDVLRDRGLEMEWWVGPSSSPGDLVERLHRVPDFATGNAIPGMSADLADLNEPPVPDGVEIVEVNDDEVLRDWADTFAVGFFDYGPPTAQAMFDLYGQIGYAEAIPWKLFLARLDGEPVATSALYVGCGVAQMTFVSALPAARGRGVGAAVSAAPLLRAREMGYRIAVLQSSPGGKSIYERLGFVQDSTFHVFDTEE
jgi:GNAT superfamily N-acetyltransferase